MPLYKRAKEAITKQLTRIQNGERPPVIIVGKFTDKQFAEINKGRVALGLHKLEQNEIVFMGRHLYASRTKDGYSVEDMVTQITSALGEGSVPDIEKVVSYLENPKARNDGYGNSVHDRAIFEMTVRKPRAELFSVIPKGDTR